MSAILVKEVQGEQVYLDNQANYELVAIPGETYNVVNPETGKTPQDIQVTRNGDDLLLRSESLDVNVTIADFWGGACQTGETQCYAVLDVTTSNGGVGYSTITQSGPEIEKLLAGEVGTLAKEGFSLPEMSGNSLWYGIGAVAVAGIGYYAWKEHKDSSDERSSQQAKKQSRQAIDDTEQTEQVAADTADQKTDATTTTTDKVVTIKYSDLLSETSADARLIKNNNVEKVDLGGNNQQADTAAQANLQDGSGNWLKTGTQTVDNVEYAVYHHSAAGTDTSNDVYIQTGIVVM